LRDRKIKGKSSKKETDYYANQLDHYYPKSKYPYLALSILNLIPSCPTCNHIKGSRENHLYPYNEEIGEDAKFQLTPKCLGELKGIKFEVGKELDKRVELKIKDGLEAEYEKRIENSQDIFQLENKYSNATHEIKDIYFKHLLLSRKEELIREFGKELGLNEKDMREVYFGTTEKEEEHRRPMSKFTNDIIDFLGDGE